MKTLISVPFVFLVISLSSLVCWGFPQEIQQQQQQQAYDGEFDPETSYFPGGQRYAHQQGLNTYDQDLINNANPNPQPEGAPLDPSSVQNTRLQVDDYFGERVPSPVGSSNPYATYQQRQLF